MLPRSGSRPGGSGRAVRVRRGECCERVHAELGGMKTPGALMVARIPRANVPVCVFASVAKCVLRRVHSVGERLCVRKTACVVETPCVRETACVRAWYDREMAVGLRETATASPCVSVVARGRAGVELGRRRHQTRDKGQVAAVVVSRTVPDSHGSEREVRAVLRTRPPRARLRR